jgi:hypothetical protein
MTYNGKTTTAQITDECPGCPYGGLDLSRGLFDFFSDESAGVIYGTWNFGSGGGQSTPTPDPVTTTSTTPAYTPPTTTSTKNTPTSTPTPTSTTPAWSSSSSPPWSDPASSPQPNSSSSSPSPVDYSSGPASNLAVPTGTTVSDSTTHNLLAMNQDVIALGGIVVAGGRA